jgi:predicted transposase YdaD
MHNDHDAYFKELMSSPEIAGFFIRERVPADIAALLSDAPPVLLPGSFVDDHLTAHHTDLLFGVALRDCAITSAFVYVLMEHKSTPEPMTRLQLLRYMTRIWDREHRDSDAPPLTPILPIVVSQGPPRWTHALQFADLFDDLPSALQLYQPRFEHLLVDLEAIADDKLSRMLRLRARLLALKYARRADLGERLVDVLSALHALDDMEIRIVLTYLGSIEPERVGEAILTIQHERGETRMPNLIEAWADYRSAQNKDRWLAEGKAEGKVLALLKLVVRRFGEPEAAQRERILDADDAQLDCWLEAVLDVADVAELLQRRPRA